MSAVAKIEQPEVRPIAITPMEMLNIAVQQGADIEKMKQLMDLSERYEANQARKAFTAAMAQFKANPPEIVKNKHVSFTTSRGQTEYDHATLGSMCKAVIKGLAEVDISHRWVPDQSDPKVIKITCVLTHSGGHSESTTLQAGADDSGGKNGIQAIGSAVAYLERYTLFAATGLAADDMDDDGRASTGKGRITDKQLADLEAKISEVGADRAQFLKFLKVENLTELPATKLVAAIQALNDKAKGKR